MSGKSRIQSIKSGDLLPEREFKPDNVQLFLYNAALWNAHRIHFDYPYATEVEGYPGLVIAGPLLGDWLTQCVIEWLDDDGRLVSIEYSNRIASYIGEVLRTGGKVASVDRDSATAELEMFVKNEADQVITPGAAVVRFSKS
jgi:hydroxyacyl-ACP dehydratase HTD2-like protein with hotdog domain